MIEKTDSIDWRFETLTQLRSSTRAPRTVMEWLSARVLVIVNRITMGVIDAPERYTHSAGTKMNIPSLARALNAKSSAYQIGGLQALRKELKHFTRRPGSSVFSNQTTFEHWAFHHGGRTELQFNIGHDGSAGKMVRHGIAFSFETNQTLPDIDILRPKVRLFNEFLELYPEKYAHMRMWYWDHEGRSSDQMPSPIPPERIQNGVFVFLGVLRPSKSVNTHEILSDFDDLLPLYKMLCAKYGKTNVGTELETGNGTRVDVVVRQSKGYWFYEIKPYHSPRACIRDALGQLLEYSHWPNGVRASRLIVVGGNKIDEDGKQYLKDLWSLYSLPIHYMRVRT